MTKSDDWRNRKKHHAPNLMGEGKNQQLSLKTAFLLTFFSKTVIIYSFNFYLKPAMISFRIEFDFTVAFLLYFNVLCFSQQDL